MRETFDDVDQGQIRGVERRKLELARLPSLVPRAVYHLTIDPTYSPPMDPFRHRALLDLSRLGKLDIMRTDRPLIRVVPPPGTAPENRRPPTYAYGYDLDNRAHGATFLPEAMHWAELWRVAAHYGDQLEAAPYLAEWKCADLPDPDRAMVIVLAPPRARGSQRQCSLSHEVFGHVLLASRSCISGHVLLKPDASSSPGPNIPRHPYQPEIVTKKPGDRGWRTVVLERVPPGIALPPHAPFGGPFAGHGAQHNTYRVPSKEEIAKARSVWKAIERNMYPIGPPGFTEMFAATPLEFWMVPTLGVGHVEGGTGSWADHALDLLAALAMASRVGRLAVDPTKGMAVVSANGQPVSSRMAPRQVTLDLLESTLNNHYLCLMRLHMNEVMVLRRGTPADSPTGKTAKGDEPSKYSKQAGALRARLADILGKQNMSPGVRSQLQAIATRMAEGNLTLEIRSGPLSAARAIYGHKRWGPLTGLDGFEGAKGFAFKTLLHLWHADEIRPSKKSDGTQKTSPT